MRQKTEYEKKREIVENRITETTISFSEKVAELIIGGVKNLEQSEQLKVRMICLDAMAEVCLRKMGELKKQSGEKPNLVIIPGRKF